MAKACSAQNTATHKGNRPNDVLPASETMAEGEGFEPPKPCGSPVFKTSAFNLSAIPPKETRDIIHDFTDV